MESNRDLFKPAGSTEEMAERYARSLALSAATATELARYRDGREVGRLRKRVEELELKIRWQEDRITWLSKPLLIRALKKFIGRGP